MADEKDDKPKNETTKAEPVPSKKPSPDRTDDDPAKKHWGEGGDFYINKAGQRVRRPTPKE